MLKNIINTIQSKYDERMKENELYKQLLENSEIFNNLFPNPTLKEKISEHKLAYIMNTCPDLNEQKARIIASLIPIDEIYLDINYSKEIKTNKEYSLISTNKYLWIINEKEYGAIPYNSITFKIIKNNVMSKIVLLNNILLEINDPSKKIAILDSIIKDENIRNKFIEENQRYLCGIIPIYQNINRIGSGISIDKNQTIIFHTKDKNYKCNINDIENYEILLDNQVIYSKDKNTLKKITTFQNSCYQISMRITLKNKAIISLPILESNAFGTKYKSQDSIYQQNINFSKEIINKLDEYLKDNYI